MAKIFSAPEEIKKPVFNFSNITQSQEEEKNYVEQVKTWIKSQSKDPYAAEEIQIPHADGKACYLVFSTKPVELIHLPIGDEWDSPWARKLNKKDIIEKVEGRKKMDSMFQKK